MMTSNHTVLEEKAEYLSAEYAGNGRFYVGSGSAEGASYKVESPARGAHWETWSCTCRWAKHGGTGCAHVRAARMKAEHLMAERGNQAFWQAAESEPADRADLAWQEVA